MKEKGERTTSVFAKPRCGHTTRRGDAVVRPAGLVPRARRRERRRAVDARGGGFLAPCAAVSEPSRLGVKSKAGTTTPRSAMPSVSSRSVSRTRAAHPSRTQARTALLRPRPPRPPARPRRSTRRRVSAPPRARRRGRARVGCANRDPQPRTRRGRVVGDGGIGRTRRATPGRRSRACDMREDAERDRARSRTAARVRRVARDARETGDEKRAAERAATAATRARRWTTRAPSSPRRARDLTRR